MHKYRSGLRRTHEQFNSTEAQQIATTGQLIGLPLGSSSTTTSPTNTPSSTVSTASTSTSALLSNSHTDVGPAVGRVLRLLLIGVLIWWIMRRRQASFEDASPSILAVPFASSKESTPTLVRIAVPVPQRPPPSSHPSYMSSPPGTANTELGDGSVVMVQNAPGALDHSAAIGLTYGSPPMSSSTSVGLPSNLSQQMGSSSSRSMIARFVFPRRPMHRAP